MRTNNPNKIIVHHTADATPGDQFAKTKAYHIKKGWGDIGYHFLIERSGKVMAGRPIFDRGAHCIFQNHNSIGISLAGNFETETPTKAQLKSLKELIGQYNLPVYGHKDWWPTKCPGKNLYKKWSMLKLFRNEYQEIFEIRGSRRYRIRTEENLNDGYAENLYAGDPEEISDADLREKYPEGGIIG